MSERKSSRPDPGIQDILAALAAAGYPENGRPDAARRLSWVPELAIDLIDFVRLGCPRFDPRSGRPHPTLLRPLNDDLTVSRLMTDYLQQPVGAFLLGAALVTHRNEAAGMLEDMIVNGIYIRKEDGSYAHIQVPAAGHYPACPSCGVKLVHKAAFCGNCGSPTEIQPD